MRARPPGKRLGRTRKIEFTTPPPSKVPRISQKIGLLLARALERQIDGRGSEEHQQPERPPTGAVDRHKPDVLARLQHHVVRFRAQRVVSPDTVRAGGKLLRNGIAEPQHTDVLAVDLDEDLAESHVFLRLTADGDSGNVVRPSRRLDEVSAQPPTDERRERDGIAKLEKHRTHPTESCKSKKLGWRSCRARPNDRQRACTQSGEVRRSAPLAEVRTIDRVEEKMAVLGWILFGLIVGALAKLVMPGRDPGGIIVTMLLGIAGAVLGGFVGRALGWYGEGEAAGFVMSFVGAVALLALYRMITRRRTLTP